MPSRDNKGQGHLKHEQGTQARQVEQRGGERDGDSEQNSNDDQNRDLEIGLGFKLGFAAENKVE